MQSKLSSQLDKGFNMPLIKGKSQKSFVKNLKTEMEAGKPQKQSLAIAYAMKRKAEHRKKMADGGSLGDQQASGSMEQNQQALQQQQQQQKAKGGEVKMADGGDPVNAPVDNSQNSEDQDKQ